MGDEFLKFNKIAPLVVGAGFFLWGSPVHASEIEQQMKQNQDQLNQVHKQTQTFLSQIEHYLQEMNENKTKEEDFEMLADKAMVDPCKPGNPREVTKEDFIMLYNKAW